MNVDQLVMELEAADLRRRNALARAAAASATDDELRAVIRLLVNPVKTYGWARWRCSPTRASATRGRTSSTSRASARAMTA